MTGENIGDLAHVRRSVRDILLTPLRSRAMRPEYGSNLPELVDAPLNSVTLLRMKAATVSALARWEPRIVVQKVTVTVAAGVAAINLYGTYAPTGEAVALEGVTAL